MSTPIPLWPNAAPGATGTTPKDIPTITPHLLKEGPPKACVLVLPGGGYQTRAEHERTVISEWLNSIGVASAVVDYRVKPYRHPVPIGDAQRAIRTARARAAEWNIDPKRIGVLGFSAGGHLAASVSTIHDSGKSDGDAIDRVSCRPDCGILCYAVITYRERYFHSGSMNNLLGENPDDALRESLSLETRVDAHTPPIFMWTTGDDAAVPVENSLFMALSLRKHKIPYALHVFPHGRHGLGLADGDETVSAWKGLCAQWLKTIGFR